MTKKLYNKSKKMQTKEPTFNHQFWEVSLDQLTVDNFQHSQKLHYESEAELNDRLNRNERFDSTLNEVKNIMKNYLTPQQLRAVHGYYFEGKTEAEISDEMGVTRQVISQHLFGKSRNGKKVGGAIPKLRRLAAAQELYW